MKKVAAITAACLLASACSFPRPVVFLHEDDQADKLDETIMYCEKLARDFGHPQAKYTMYAAGAGALGGAALGYADDTQNDMSQEGWAGVAALVAAGSVAIMAWAVAEKKNTQLYKQCVSERHPVSDWKLF